MKMLYNATSPKVSWELYWREMTKEKPAMEWADGWFIQVTAWYLGLDLWIFDTACQEFPYITEIQGNMDNPEDGTPCELVLGYLHNAHYQSLLWDFGKDEEVLIDTESFPPDEWKFTVQDWMKEMLQEEEAKRQLTLISCPQDKNVLGTIFFSMHYSFQNILSILRYTYFRPIFGGN